MNLDGKGGTPQVNLTVSLCLACCTALLAIFAFPETLHESKDIANHSPEEDETEESETQKPQPRTKIILHTIQKPFRNFAESVTGIGVLNITLLALSTCFANSGIKAIDWYALIQYPVIKLHWTYPQA